MTDAPSDILPLRAAYDYAAKNGISDEMQTIRDMDIEWDQAGGSSLRRGYVIRLLEKKGLLDDFKHRCWPAGNTTRGERKYRWYQTLVDRYESFLADGKVEAPAAEQSLEFALEAHLRDFLARNLDRIEPGLRLYSLDGSTGIEYSIGWGRIDLLAVDHQEKFVVVELKLSQGRNKALGQLLSYMGWVDENLGKGPCRGIIIAGEISDELATAVTRAPGVSVAKYRMNFSIEVRNSAPSHAMETSTSTKTAI